MPAALGRGKQIGFGLLARLLQPQHAAGHLRQQPHPDRENRRGDLPVGIEAAEDECRLRARPASARDGAVPMARLVVVGKETMRQQGQLFPERPRIGRDDAIGDDIVHEGRGGGAGIAQPARLHRLRACG